MDRTGDEEMVENEGMGERHLLVAVEDPERSDKVVLYVADVCGGTGRFRVTLFHVITVPQAEVFADPVEREKWLQEREKECRDLLERYRSILVQSGFPREKVDILCHTTESEPVAEAILRKHGEIGSCTMVIGRRGKSRQEEFLFGSVSTRIVRQARKCSVWIVE